MPDGGTTVSGVSSVKTPHFFNFFSTGNVLTVLVMVVGGLGAFYELKSDVALTATGLTTKIEALTTSHDRRLVLLEASSAQTAQNFKTLEDRISSLRIEQAVQGTILRGIDERLRRNDYRAPETPPQPTGGTFRGTTP